jgi:septal ring factor EnvC (AmiA/AmiB activator)
VEEVESATDKLNEAVQEIVGDPQRAKRITTLAHTFTEVAGQHIRDEETHQTRLNELNRDYEATRESFTALLAARQAETRRLRHRVLEFRKELLAQTTPEEWARLEARRVDVVEALSSALRFSADFTAAPETNEDRGVHSRQTEGQEVSQ